MKLPNKLAYQLRVIASCLDEDDKQDFSVDLQRLAAEMSGNTPPVAPTPSREELLEEVEQIKAILEQSHKDCPHPWEADDACTTSRLDNAVRTWSEDAKPDGPSGEGMVPSCDVCLATGTNCSLHVVVKGKRKPAADERGKEE